MGVEQRDARAAAAPSAVVDTRQQPAAAAGEQQQPAAAGAAARPGPSPGASSERGRGRSAAVERAARAWCATTTHSHTNSAGRQRAGSAVPDAREGFCEQQTRERGSASSRPRAAAFRWLVGSQRRVRAPGAGGTTEAWIATPDGWARRLEGLQCSETHEEKREMVQLAPTAPGGIVRHIPHHHGTAGRERVHARALVLCVHLQQDRTALSSEGWRVVQGGDTHRQPLQVHPRAGALALDLSSVGHRPATSTPAAAAPLPSNGACTLCWTVAANLCH